MVESSPAAVVLVNAVDRIVFSSRSARRLLADGGRLEGRSFGEVLRGIPGPLAEAMGSGSTSLVGVQVDGEDETFHVARRTFELNASRHTLLTVRRMTPELRRQEVEVWKRLIRVVGHELNNGLAPISSLVHSARTIRERPEAADRLDEVLSAIEDSADRLRRFVDGYARFARLPAPRPEPVRLHPFLRHVAELEPCRVGGCPETLVVEADAAQLQVVLVNLVKNAREAGSPIDRIELSAAAGGGGVALRVSDRGPGMDPETMAKAVLPFYSSKKTGSGLGLALCREIVEAHGGTLELASRDGGGLEVTVRIPAGPSPGG
jgi:signal transduction histidine kinase